MTDDEIMKSYEEMADMFGDKLPNPDHYPLTFAYYVKLYKYYKGMP